MARMAAFRFTARDDSVLTEEVRRHIGARRFAYNPCLEAVRDKLDERRSRPDAEVPWSGYSLINWWNGWKRSADAGRVFAVDPSGRAELVDAGLSWRNEVCAQVFEEAAVDLGRALAAFSASKKGARRGERVGFPHFQKKGQGPESFRLRNRVSRTGHHCIRVGEQGARSLTLPVIGPVALREDTRRLLRPGPDGVPRAPWPGLPGPSRARCPGRPTGPRHALVWGASTGVGGTGQPAALQGGLVRGHLGGGPPVLRLDQDLLVVRLGLRRDAPGRAGLCLSELRPRS
jgi:hypothetical protein